MIKDIYISNFALIDDLRLNLSHGFSTITGETGAGKSILLEALSLALGERVDKSVVRDQEKKCIIELQFSIGEYELESFFKKMDWDYEPETFIRREILPSGKSRAFVNDTPVVLTDLKELGENLIKISSQHETLALKETDFQLNVLDAFIDDQSLLSKVSGTYEKWKKTAQKLKESEQEIAKVKGDRDYLSFQLEELIAAELEKENLEELEQELTVSEKAEQLIANTQLGYQLLDEENGILELIGKIEQELKSVARYDDELTAFFDRLVTAKEELKDLSHSFNAYSEKIDVSPERLSYLNNRVDVLNQLLLKHKKNELSELVKLRDEIHHQLENSDALELDLAQMRSQLKELENQYFDLAAKLTKERKIAGKKIEKEVGSILSDLGMADAEIQFSIDKNTSFSAKGLDQIELQFKANEGLGFKSLKKTASGGELSRLMLAVLSIYSHKKKLPTIIFDEIDTGVSGNIADKIARLMHKMSEKMQIIAITHLPQVAAKGHQQLMVTKYKDGQQTFSTIAQLNDDDRVEQLAKMLSGNELTKPALAQAKELLK